MLNLLAPAATQWHNIGVGLKVTAGVIDKVYAELTNERPISKLAKVLRTWMDTESSPVTWENIITVVEGPIVARKKEAQAIREFLAKDENFEHYKNQ